VNAIGLKTAKRTNKLEPVPAHRKHGTDKFSCASSQTRTAYILHSQFGMNRFIELHSVQYRSPPLTIFLLHYVSVCI